MSEPQVKAMVLAGFGMNCDHETKYALDLAGARTDRVHVNELIDMAKKGGGLSDYHLLAIGGGFAWADDHGAGVLLGVKLRAHLGSQIEDFIAAGGLIIGICNGFQALVTMGLIPGFDNDYRTRRAALLANNGGNFIDDWVTLIAEPESPCVFTKGLTSLELPIRHGEGMFYAPPEVMERLEASNQIALRYGAPLLAKARMNPVNSRAGAVEDVSGFFGDQARAFFHTGKARPAEGEQPFNPNGSLADAAGVCDPTGRVFGLMPHPEAFHHLTNHPQWTRKVDHALRWERPLPDQEGAGLKIFKNAVEYIKQNLSGS